MFNFLLKLKTARKKRPVRANADYLRLKDDARRIVHERLDHFNKHYRFAYGRVSVRDQKSRWGSCSGKGNLNFNYRIAILPPELQDYLVVHELCHLSQMNHSPAFWSLVAETVPDWRDRHRALRSVRMAGGPSVLQ